MDAFDVIVVGGGPAGLMAAVGAAERGRRVLLLEKNGQLGKKLRLTGGGRCNITHAQFDRRLLLEQYGPAARFLHASFARFDVADTFAFFEARGLPLEVESHGRAFPASRRAADVAVALERAAREAGVHIRLSAEVRAVRPTGKDRWRVDTARDRWTAASLVLATGGLSHPHTGSTGDGLQWLRDLGHTVHPPNPDLVSLRVRGRRVFSPGGLADPGRTLRGTGPLGLAGALCQRFGPADLPGQSAVPAGGPGTTARAGPRSLR